MAVGGGRCKVEACGIDPVNMTTSNGHACFDYDSCGDPTVEIAAVIETGLY